MAEEFTQARSSPVYSGYFADPFVWKSEEVYYAIGTGAREAAGQTFDRVFPILRSTDFSTWQFAGRALMRPDRLLGNTFWAPEIAATEDGFYLYYSVGHEDKNHQLRVGFSADPLGPYTDVAGPMLSMEQYPFAIDPHPFQDEDGQWYLFFATDFLDANDQVRAGTALMVDRLRSMTELAGEPRVVLRARHDWQRFEHNRLMYGRRFDWHTLEGPCVRKHDGRYYLLYSGGKWESDNYGVDFAVADSVMGPYHDESTEAGPRVLRTVPGELLGPGHNSLIVGPDEQDHIVYHAWDREMKMRQMFVERLEWTPQGPRLAG